MLGRQNDWRALGVWGLRDLNRQLEEFRREWDRLLFENERGGFGLGTDGSGLAALADEGSEWVLRAELPGLSEKAGADSAREGSMTSIVCGIRVGRNFSSAIMSFVGRNFSSAVPRRREEL